MRTKRLSGLVLLVSVMLSGCTPAAPPSFEHVSATIRPPGLGPASGGSSTTPSISWVGGSTERVLLTVQGGVGCPPVPVRIEVVSPVAVTLEMKTYTGACTTDTGPKTSESALPAGVSRRKEVLFTLTTTDPEPERTARLRAPRS